jgi:hypothetical protein
MIPMKKTRILCEEWLSDSKSSEFELEDEYRRKWRTQGKGEVSSERSIRPTRQTKIRKNERTWTHQSEG